MSTNNVYDAIILGAGPAGLSCALELHDSKLNYLVLERENRAGGQLWCIDNEIKNFVGAFAQDGPALAHKLLELIEGVSLNIQFNCKIDEINVKTQTITASGKTFQAHALILATGARIRELELPGMDRFRRDIFYQIEGNETQLKGRQLAILGGGDNALMDSILCSADCPQITLIHRSDTLRARPDVIERVRSERKINTLLNTIVQELIGEERLSGLKVLSKDSGRSTIVPAEKLVIKIGYTPNTEPFKGQVDMDGVGNICIDQFCHTSASGVFAIGDITNPGYPRIATAVGHGAIAAHRIRALFL